MKQPAPGEWQYTVGDVPAQLTAYERPDRGNAIYTRVWNGRAYTRKQFLCASIRDAKERIDAALETKAQQLAIDRQAAIEAGVEPDEGGPLTLGRGLRVLLDEQDGKYVGDGTWRKEVRRYLETVVEFLDPATLWQDIEHAHYRKLWRALAREHADSGRFGLRATEAVVGALQSASRWLQQEGKVKPGSALPAPGWKRIMREEWAGITASPLLPPKKLRYTRAEQAKLIDALDQADPRIRFAVELAAELRLGQVPRSRRSDIQPHGTHPIGKLRVHGKGKKLGSEIVLNDSERAVITEAITTGYLSDLERAYQAGDIPDYFLITGGQLAKGKAQIRHALNAWGKTGMVKKWKTFEKLAKVRHVDGRNWYGLRRLYADLAEDESSDARVLNRLGGWSHTKTRESYQEQGRTEIAERASEVREKIRRQSAKLPQTVSPADKSGESEGVANAV